MDAEHHDSLDDRYDLERFRSAQTGVYSRALAELRRGRKTGHWIWFVFPQVAGLGASAMSQRYAISGLGEARAYLADPVLGARLTEAATVVLGHRDRSAEDILGAIDAVKLRSSMTLFGRADPTRPVFATVLRAFYHGTEDDVTLRLLPDRPGPAATVRP